MPSPTRAMMVSSVAPPTNRSRCERTVTRAFTLAPMRTKQASQDPRTVAARQTMRFDRIARNVNTDLHHGDAIIDDASNGHLPQPHAHHFSQADRRVRDPGATPEREEIKKDDAQD